MPKSVNSFETTSKHYAENVYTWLKFEKFVGQFWFSKNSTGENNKLSIRIYGSKGSIKWEHSQPEELVFLITEAIKILLTDCHKTQNILRIMIYLLIQLDILVDF